MDWIFDNLQLLIAAGAGIAYWLNQRKEAQSEDEQDHDTGYAPVDPDAADDAERARKIREEIRRKIAERSGSPRPPVFVPEPEPPPLVQTDYERPMPVDDPYAHDEWRDEPVEPVGPSAEELAMLERQKLLQERMKELEAKRSQAQHSAAAVSRKRRTRSSTKGMRDLRDDLRETGSLRRAIVLREVLGPPVSMR